MAASATFALKAVCGSGVRVCSCSLLIHGLIAPAVRQKLHLASCADFRSRLWCPFFYQQCVILTLTTPFSHPTVQTVLGNSLPVEVSAYDRASPGAWVD